MRKFIKLLNKIVIAKLKSDVLVSTGSVFGETLSFNLRKGVPFAQNNVEEQHSLLAGFFEGIRTNKSRLGVGLKQMESIINQFSEKNESFILIRHPLENEPRPEICLQQSFRPINDIRHDIECQNFKKIGSIGDTHSMGVHAVLELAKELGIPVKKINVRISHQTVNALDDLGIDVMQTALLCEIVSHCVGAVPGKLVWFATVCFLIEEQLIFAEKQIRAFDEAGKPKYRLPVLRIDTTNRNFTELNPEDFWFTSGGKKLRLA